MRDKEGRALVNAHVLGFLRRISKLLFYGIKPVFVFDGGAPTLKRNTLNDRRKKKSGAAASHHKIAEKLLAAQMRREALNHAQKASSTKAKPRRQELNDDTVYLEDIDGSAPRTPARRKPPPPTSSSAKKTKATRSVAPDPRLATEDELRTFIEDMRPEDFDINSPAFRELPTELKSRQTSYARLHKMLKSTRTPMDFSKQQIMNLRQRNALTQQLLMTTDSIGNAHIAIPNEGADGGWILGIKDIGTTREKPIVLDHDETKAEVDDVDSDADMEEVEVPTPAPHDPDLREYQREMALSGISARNTSKGLRPLTTRPINRKTKNTALFDTIEDEVIFPVQQNIDSDDDDMIAYAIKLHWISHRILEFSALSMANTSPRNTRTSSTPNKTSSLFGKPSLLSTPSKLSLPDQTASESSDDMEEVIAAPRPIRFETPLTNAPSGSVVDALENAVSNATTSFPSNETTPTAFTLSGTLLQQPQEVSAKQSATSFAVATESERDKDLEDISFGIGEPQAPTLKPTEQPMAEPSSTIADHTQTAFPMTLQTPNEPPSSSSKEIPSLSFTLSGTLLQQPQVTEKETMVMQVSADPESDEDMEEIPVEIEKSQTQLPKPRNMYSSTGHHRLYPPTAGEPEPLFAWSHAFPPPEAAEAEEWDAAQEMDPHAEEGEFARFMSQMKGRNVEDVRKEIDEEIRGLNQQRKAAMRDSEDITQQMITQIMTMLRLFGIPYITAPMEAEAQCAELVALGLVDGVITDDSDNMFNQSKTVECFLSTDLSRELGLDRDTLIQLAYLLGSDYTEGLPGIGPVVAMELLKEFPGRDGLFKFRDWWSRVQSGKDKEEDNKSKFRRQFVQKEIQNLYLASDWPNSVVRDAYYHPAVDSSEEPFKWGMPDLDGLRKFFEEELSWHQSKVDELLLPIIQRMNKRNQVAALNKQGTLNDYLDLSAGSGSHAPRQRQAYASRRLQQVISDFRNSRKSGSVRPQSPSASEEAGQNSDYEEGASTKKRKRSMTPASEGGSKGKGKAKAKASTTRSAKVARGASTSARAKGRGRGGKSRAGKGKARELSENDEDSSLSSEQDDFMPPADDAAVMHREIELNLRPRPNLGQDSKIKPTQKRAPLAKALQKAKHLFLQSLHMGIFEELGGLEWIFYRSMMGG
ncbi:PIN domain-like protein [Pholiota molesta]|nr:PIN domain-like protein [Pholiota molesta]